MGGFLIGVIMFGAGLVGSGGDIAPVPANLTDACKIQHVQVAGTNYSYDTYEGCLKK